MTRPNRTTWRLTDENYDYILSRAKQLQLSANDVINMIVRIARMRSDSKVTAEASNDS